MIDYDEYFKLLKSDRNPKSNDRLLVFMYKNSFKITESLLTMMKMHIYNNDHLRDKIVWDFVKNNKAEYVFDLLVCSFTIDDEDISKQIINLIIRSNRNCDYLYESDEQLFACGKVSIHFEKYIKACLGIYTIVALSSLERNDALAILYNFGLLDPRFLNSKKRNNIVHRRLISSINKLNQKALDNLSGLIKEYDLLNNKRFYDDGFLSIYKWYLTDHKCSPVNKHLLDWKNYKALTVEAMRKYDWFNDEFDQMKKREQSEAENKEKEKFIVNELVARKTSFVFSETIWAINYLKAFPFASQFPYYHKIKYSFLKKAKYLLDDNLDSYLLTIYDLETLNKMRLDDVLFAIFYSSEDILIDYVFSEMKRIGLFDYNDLITQFDFDIEMVLCDLYVKIDSELEAYNTIDDIKTSLGIIPSNIFETKNGSKQRKLGSKKLFKAISLIDKQDIETLINKWGRKIDSHLIASEGGYIRLYNIMKNLL